MNSKQLGPVYYVAFLLIRSSIYFNIHFKKSAH